MPTLRESIVMACAALGLRVEPDFVLKFGSVEIRTVARIPELGYRNGMLIVTSFDAVKKHLKQLDELGYGFSVLDDRPERSFNLASWREVFNDWGWNGEKGKEPAWYKE